VPPSKATLEQAFNQLWEWCRERDFSGHDPFDALNSSLFRSLPFSDTRTARLAWTQLLKRSPFDLRGLTQVPAEKNPKGIALFALAALSRERTNPTDSHAAEARVLLQTLLELRVGGWKGAAWGYNFHWQSRYFFAPRGTPTIVPTAFAARALIEGFEVFGDEHFLQTARSACDFVLNDLERPIETEDWLCFSYAPQTQTRIYNASLLAAEVLAAVGAKTGEKNLRTDALRATRYVVSQQRTDGSWSYGADPNQHWIDNFHTAFVLSSLARIIYQVGDEAPSEFRESLIRGYDYWSKAFFLADGWPKYYDDALYPADIHSAGAAIVTLCDLKDLTSDGRTNPLMLAQKISEWSLKNLHDQSGYFYYQRRRFQTVRTPFMRWGQAWMSYSLARLIED
jgi:hypothetical protein